MKEKVSGRADCNFLKWFAHLERTSVARMTKRVFSSYVEGTRAIGVAQGTDLRRNHWPLKLPSGTPTSPATMAMAPVEWRYSQ